ncbi:hypothetical protein [Cyanobium sp. ATX-6F1]|uniref:hypothetical protein n=1 Tax=Cyanobium sp. ATX-6F1 TaxID=3137388 RepID=UPI0039BDA8C0
MHRYGRTVAEVIGEINLGLAMAEYGLAYPLREPAATPISSTWANAMPRSIWRRSSGVSAAAMEYGKCPAASPALRTSAAAEQQGAQLVAPGSVPDGRKYRCKEIGAYQQAQLPLRQGHTYLDSNGDGEACESLR